MFPGCCGCLLLLVQLVVAELQSSIPVVIFNAFDFQVFVYHDTGSSGHFLVQLESKTHAALDTYLHHKFYVKQFPSSRGVVSRLVVAELQSSIPVVIFNAFDFQVFVYHDTGSSGHFLVQLESKTHAALDTYLHHKFYVKQFPSSRGVVSRFDIKVNESYYVLQDRKARTIVSLNFIHGHDNSSEFSHSLMSPHSDPAISLARAVKFRSLHPRQIDVFYDGEFDGSFMGTLEPGQEMSITAYINNSFYFKEAQDMQKIVGNKFTVSSSDVLHLIHQQSNANAEFDAIEHSVTDGISNSLLSEAISLANSEKKFGTAYLARTGRPWLHYFSRFSGPRSPPRFFMWPAERLGQAHQVISREGHWKCHGAQGDCRQPSPLSLLLEVISRTPRVFLISDFLNSFEADHLISLAKFKTRHSSIGSHASGVYSDGTRTSRNAWLPRNTDKITDSIYRRVADMLQIDERIFTSEGVAEDIQVVHYRDGQKYDAHHDWSIQGYEESRFITVLLYLTDQEDCQAGGETAFPRAVERDENVIGNDKDFLSDTDILYRDSAFRITPAKGHAAVFYNLLPDGNADDLSLHEALPVIRGEKWLANIWVWDPKIKIS